MTLMLIQYGTKNSFKYFTGYNDNDVIRPLCVKLPQVTGYVKKLMIMGQRLLILAINSFLKSITKYGKNLNSY